MTDAEFAEWLSKVTTEHSGLLKLGVLPEGLACLNSFRKGATAAREKLGEHWASEFGEIYAKAEALAGTCEIYEKLRNRNICDACAGEGKPNCMCSGTGLMSEAAYYLREQLYKSEQKAEALAVALEKYADREKWGQFISSGNIFDECEGDFMMAFNDGEDAPWSFAEKALKDFRGEG